MSATFDGYGGTTLPTADKNECPPRFVSRRGDINDTVLFISPSQTTTRLSDRQAGRYRQKYYNACGGGAATKSRTSSSSSWTAVKKKRVPVEIIISTLLSACQILTNFPRSANSFPRDTDGVRWSGWWQLCKSTKICRITTVGSNIIPILDTDNENRLHRHSVNRRTSSIELFASAHRPINLLSAVYAVVEQVRLE